MEKFIVLDVEGMQGQKPYDIGYIVADREGNIYKTQSLCIFSNIVGNVAAARNCHIPVCRQMTLRNISHITADSENPPSIRRWKILVNNRSFMQIFSRDTKKFRIKKVFAFNVKFDKKMIENIYGKELTKLEWCDIQSAILYTKLLTKKYLDFCYNNNFRTPKGYAQTKAETVYRYLTGNIDFIEEHTGLSDVFIEYQILLTAYRTKKKMIVSPCQAWKELNKKAKEINHPIAR